MVKKLTVFVLAGMIMAGCSKDQDKNESNKYGINLFGYDYQISVSIPNDTVVPEEKGSKDQHLLTLDRQIQAAKDQKLESDVSSLEMEIALSAYRQARSKVDSRLYDSAHVPLDYAREISERFSLKNIGEEKKLASAAYEQAISKVDNGFFVGAEKPLNFAREICVRFSLNNSDIEQKLVSSAYKQAQKKVDDGWFDNAETPLNYARTLAKYNHFDVGEYEARIIESALQHAENRIRSYFPVNATESYYFASKTAKDSGINNYDPRIEKVGKLLSILD